MKSCSATQTGSSDGDLVRALARGLGILELLKDQGPLTLTQVATQLNVHKSTVSRLLNTLCTLDFVEREADSQKYHIGLQLLTYGPRVVNDLALRRVAMPHLKTLQQDSRETVLLSTLHRGMVLWLEILHTPARTYQLRWGGQMSYAHSTSAGKAMLAYLPPAESERVCHTVGLPRQTENTITTWEGLREELCRTRERGYAVDICENIARLCCIGACIFGTDDRVLGAISVSFPANRFTPDIYLPVVLLLKQACQDVSQSMGASGEAIMQLMVEERSS